LKEHGFRLYQPALRPDQIKALYMLKLKVRRPMTCLVREAVDRFLREQSLAALLKPLRRGIRTRKKEEAAGDFCLRQKATDPALSPLDFCFPSVLGCGQREERFLSHHNQRGRRSC
jgi:hypothetical protein